MGMYTEAQDLERFRMLGIPRNIGLGGIQHFDSVGVNTLKALAMKGYLDYTDCQNNSPTAGEIVSWLEQHPKFLAHGYIVSNERDDRCITIEGVEIGKDYSRQDMRDFSNMFHNADEFEIEDDYMRAWYD